ncbi:unnamed protein product [Effrenium voratum]|uniref:Iron-binding zinc finger CDGSH type domain-containing protein n=1 Tax=Effrenium voratum TaxID=2562239 RepID=A0AA36JC00_9DINO|nr:unnamed protein product [Effrenium voratum]CAJ1415461.1 unnamed protein product [Effrenium voratum]|mmetsp:Transcript_27151/g.64625  ORF Transcript_27151/g.64625 Transcript_27151/m.64625 type:complete len:137 (+) Transcript_27151:64-474(+)
MEWPPPEMNYNTEKYDKYHHLIQYAAPGEAKKVSVCRCWQSKKFPYCDGTHKKLIEAGDNVGPYVVKVNPKPATTDVAANYLRTSNQLPRTAAFFALGFGTVGLACAATIAYARGFRLHGEVRPKDKVIPERSESS